MKSLSALINKVAIYLVTTLYSVLRLGPASDFFNDGNSFFGLIEIGDFS